MSLEKEFIPYEQALELKDLGFDEPCVCYKNKLNEMFIYDFQSHPDEFIGRCADTVIKSPTYSQSFRWFRDTYEFIGVPTISNYSDDSYVFDIFQKFNDEIYFEGSDLSFKNNGNKEYNTYEEAELACLKKLIEIVKNK